MGYDVDEDDEDSAPPPNTGMAKKSSRAIPGVAPAPAAPAAPAPVAMPPKVAKVSPVPQDGMAPVTPTRLGAVA